MFSLFVALMGITAVGLFATQKNDLERGYIVQFYFCFYMQVSCIVGTHSVLYTFSLYFFPRRKIFLLLFYPTIWNIWMT